MNHCCVVSALALLCRARHCQAMLHHTHKLSCTAYRLNIPEQPIRMVERSLVNAVGCPLPCPDMLAMLCYAAPT